MGDIVFCVKDRDGVYTAVNQAFVERVKSEDKSSLVGKTASEVFAPPLAAGFNEQDKTVFENERPIQDQLERITNADGTMGWYLASKFPVFDDSKNVIGLVGISQDCKGSNSRLMELKWSAKMSATSPSVFPGNSDRGSKGTGRSLLW